MKKIYIVKRGDDFSTIAKKLQVSIEDILEANITTKSRSIKAGDVIVIPKNSPVYKQNT